MNQQDIEQVVKAVLLKMKDSSQPASTVHEMGVFASLDDAVAAAKRAQQGLKSVAMRQLAIHAIREAGEKHARELAELAVSEPAWDALTINLLKTWRRRAARRASSVYLRRC